MSAECLFAWVAHTCCLMVKGKCLSSHSRTNKLHPHV
jgi:hypothetical protein